MVYIEEWSDFELRAKELFMARPNKTRYTMKYRHSDSELVLKVTDDIVCIKYKTDQINDLKFIEKLNNFFLGTMSSNRLEEAVDAVNEREKEEVVEDHKEKQKKKKRRRKQ